MNRLLRARWVRKTNLGRRVSGPSRSNLAASSMAWPAENAAEVNIGCGVACRQSVRQGTDKKILGQTFVRVTQDEPGVCRRCSS